MCEGKDFTIHIRVVYCVEKPGEQKSYQVTKEFHVHKRLYKDVAVEEGGTIQVNHIVSVTGDPKSSILAAELDHECQRSFDCISVVCIGGMFAGVVLMAAAAACGVVVAVYIPLLMAVLAGVHICW